MVPRSSPEQLSSSMILLRLGNRCPAGGVGFWCNESERDRARALCTRLGTGLYKHALGFGGQGLLLVFPDTCPNNSLPILFAGRAGANAWNPLFPRPSS